MLEVKEVLIRAFVSSKENLAHLVNVFGFENVCYQILTPFYTGSKETERYFRESSLLPEMEIFRFLDPMNPKAEKDFFTKFDLDCKYVLVIKNPIRFYSDSFFTSRNFLKEDWLLTGIAWEKYDELRKEALSIMILPDRKKGTPEDLAIFLEKGFPFYYIPISKYNLASNFLFGRKETFENPKREIRLAFNTLVSESGDW